MRLWVACVDYQADVRVSDDILKQVAEVYRKIRNTFRFLLGNLHDFNPETDSNCILKTLAEVDRYMLIKLQDVVRKVRDSYEQYDFSTIYHTINNFCTVDLSSFYLDFAKDILYIEKADNNDDAEAFKQYMYETVVSLTKLLSPILPHTADEVWNYIPGVEEESVQLTDMPEPRTIENEEEIRNKWNRLIEVREDVLKALEVARTEKVIGKSLEAKVTIVPKDEETKQLLLNTEYLHQYLIVSEVDVVDELNNATDYHLVKVFVEKHSGEKCERCWVSSHTVGTNEKHPTLCERCATIVG